VLVTEAHAAFRNLLPELLDRRAELLRGDPKPDGMMAGLAPDVDAILFIGYHGKAGTARSVMSHTISGGVIADVRCDGRSLGELGLNTALAAHSGVPAVWPEPSVPPDLAAALAGAPQKIQDLWNEITPMARWEWVRWVNATKNPDTRTRRVEVSISKMQGGKRRPCCFNLSACTDPDLSKHGRLLEPGDDRP
jgi:hypothetical protein